MRTGLRWKFPDIRESTGKIRSFRVVQQRPLRQINPNNPVLSGILLQTRAGNFSRPSREFYAANNDMQSRDSLAPGSFDLENSSSLTYVICA